MKKLKFLLMIWLFRIRCFKNSLCLGFILPLSSTSANWITISLVFGIKKINVFVFQLFQRIFVSFVASAFAWLFLVFGFFWIMTTTKIKTKKFGFGFLVTGWCNERNNCIPFIQRWWVHNSFKQLIMFLRFYEFLRHYYDNIIWGQH